MLIPRPTSAPRGRRWVDDTFGATAEDYTLAVADAAAAIGDWPGLQRVLQFGQVGAPGISDIDLLLVFEDDVDWRKLPRWSSLGPQVFRAPLFLHAPFAIHASALPRIGELFHVESLADVRTGETFAPRPAAEPAQLCWNYSAALAMVRVLGRLCAHPTPSVRTALCFLNAVRYNAALASPWFSDPRIDRFVASVAGLRSDWIAGVDRDPERLDVALDTGLEVLMTILRAHARRVPEFVAGWPDEPFCLDLAPFDLVVRYGFAGAEHALPKFIGGPHRRFARTELELPLACGALHAVRLAALPLGSGGRPARIRPRRRADALGLLQVANPLAEALTATREVEASYARFMNGCRLPLQYLVADAPFDRRPLSPRQRLARWVRAGLAAAGRA